MTATLWVRQIGVNVETHKYWSGTHCCSRGAPQQGAPLHGCTAG
jgi:hypothetical protein